MIAESQTRQRTTRRFLLKLALFALPLAIPFLLLSGYMIYTGEAMPLEIVARMQMGDAPILYRPRYGNRDLDFKTLSANLRQPEIMAVGSSRVLQFRAQFFDKQPRAFYNGGAPGWTLTQVRQLLDGLTFTPRILIIGMDQSWFDDNVTLEPLNLDHVSDLQNLFTINRSFMQEVLKGVIGEENFDYGRYLARVEPGHGGLALGLRAIRDGHGFRNDGSEQYGDFLVAHWLDPNFERQRHLEYARLGFWQFAYGDTVSTGEMAKLEDFLRWCQDRGVRVIGFLPSFLPTLYQRTMADGNHTYISKLDDALAPLFTKYGDAYFNFSDGAALGASDEDFFDGWHASERINLRLYEKLLAGAPELLGQYSDPAALATADASATDTFDVFGNRTQ